MTQLVALWLAFGLAWPSPALALRPRAGGLEERTAVTAELSQQLAPTAGLEERSRTLLEAVDATAWTQLQDFARRMKAQGRRWDESVRIAGVLTDADWTILSPKTGNLVTAPIAWALAWVLDHEGVVRVVTASSPEMVADRVETEIRARLKSPRSIERFNVFARSGGLRVTHLNDERTVRPAGRILTVPEQRALLAVFAEAVLGAIAVARPSPSIDDLRKALPKAENVDAIVTLIEDAEHRVNLVRPNDVIVHWDHGFPTMLLVTFADEQLDAKALLDTIQPQIAAQFPSGPPLYFSRGPHYVAAGLYRKSETVAADLAGGAYDPQRNPGVVLIAGDGALDDLEAMREAARRFPNLLILPYFVGDPAVVRSDEAIIVPARDTSVKATEAFLSRLVHAAEFAETYAELPLLRGRYTLQELAKALGISVDDFLAEMLPQAFSAFAARRQARLTGGLEEPTDPGDPTVPAPNPATATAKDVADYLTRRWEVPIRQENNRYLVDQWAIPVASWTMPEIRDPKPGRIIEDMAAMSVRAPTYPLKNLPIFSVSGTSARGVYLGFVEGIDHPVVIKIGSQIGQWWPGDIDEVVNAQIFEHQGSAAAVYGVIWQVEGHRGYVMQAVPGRSPQSDDVAAVLAHPDVLEIRRRAGEAGLGLPSIVHTRSNRYVGMDAGNAQTMGADRRTAWIVAQNAGWAIHELRVTRGAPDGQAYLLEHEAALAALFLLQSPEAPLLPVMALVTPEEAERLRAIARQGGFSDRVVRVWEQDYLLVYRPEVSGDRERASGEAMSRLGGRLQFAMGGEALSYSQPQTIRELPRALDEFGLQLNALAGGFGLTIAPETWTDQAVQDLFRAAQA